MKIFKANKQNQIKNVVTNIRNHIDFSGVWATNTIHLPLNVIVWACFVITLIAQIFDIAMARHDWEKFFERYSIFSFSAMGVLKLKSLTINKKKWSTLLITLNGLEDKQLIQKPDDDDYESDGEDLQGKLKSYYEKYTYRFHSIYNIIIKIYYFTVCIFVSSPFIEFIYWKVINGQESVRNPHLLLAWTPLDDLGIWGYVITISVEVVTTIYTVIVHTSFDLMAFGLMIMLGGQFQLLREYSEHIAGNGKGYDITKRRDERARLRIKKCHNTLMILEHSVLKLDKLISNILGIYFLVAIFALCSVALRLTVEEMSIMKVVSLVQYTSGCLVQLYFLCYYGDIVLHQSSVGVGEGPLACAWWRVHPRVRRDLLLLGIGQAREKRLRAGPFNTLDLVSFIQIVRAAYSYYAVIHK